MRIHIIFHSNFEPLTVIGNWCKERGHSLSITRICNNEELPPTSSFDFLISMGGPESCVEIHRFPYLLPELSLIKKSIDEKKIVLGLCLGAQLIGNALGATAEPSPEREIGIFPIMLNPEAGSDPISKNFPARVQVVHWHDDMPGITQGAVVLAKSDGCPRQIIRYAPRVYGIQCHFEITREVAQGLIEECPEELRPGRLVQNAKDILASDFSSINKLMLMILDQLVLQAFC